MIVINVKRPVLKITMDGLVVTLVRLYAQSLVLLKTFRSCCTLSGGDVF